MHPLCLVLPAGLGSTVMATTDPAPSGGASGGGSTVSPAAIGGIVAGCACVVGLAGFVVSRTLGDQMRKNKDADKSKQLAYMYEMDENDISEWQMDSVSGSLLGWCGGVWGGIGCHWVGWRGV